jgi:uncharacterized HAD superfamily protein
MKRLTIGMDIDGVIVDYGNAMLPLISLACQRQISYSDLWSRDLAECLNLDKKTVEYIWEQTLGTDMLLHASPIPGVIKGLATVSEHEIWLVTGRPASMQPLTLSWLNQKKVKYDCIVFDKLSNKISTGPRFDIFIEDFLEEARIMAEAGTFTLLLDQPWNQAPSLPQNCQRVHDWNTIVQLINRLQKV